MAPHSSTVAPKIPWMEEPGRLQSMGSLRVGHNWGTSLSLSLFHALEKEMATHSSVLAWRIPGRGKPGGLPSMGSHRVGHYWSDLAAAAAATPLYLFHHDTISCIFSILFAFFWTQSLASNVLLGVNQNILQYHKLVKNKAEKSKIYLSFFPKLTVGFNI